MSDEALREDDRRRIEAHGLTVEEATRQLALYRRPPNYSRLLRPCTPGDGIVVLDDVEIGRLRAVYEGEVRTHAALKFVPASGAASRMFKVPLQYLSSAQPISRAQLRRDASRGESHAAELEQLLAGAPELALWEDLAQALSRDGRDPAAALEGNDVRVVLEYLLTARGLGYAELPKALLEFHRYDGERRTPLEEHMVEAAAYVRDGTGTCRLHFTVSAEHLERCRALAVRASRELGARFGVRYDIDFSLQKPSTDSLAVDPSGAPFRDASGNVLLRPAGHGALIENLSDLDADIVFLKNVDNVVPDRLKGPVHAWKQALGGLLVELQSEAFAHLAALEAKGADTAAVDAAMVFLDEALEVRPAALHASEPFAKRRAAAIALLDRPLRVCGMVANRGEAGGGPFWVQTDGGETKQIVETPQVDPADAEQQAMVRSAPFFNPVDVACTLRDRRGRRYDLNRFVDPDAYLVVEKSHEGRPLRAIERPGLWNGGMARWNTVFVEVPVETFAPVKTINDLLRPEHRA